MHSDSPVVVVVRDPHLRLLYYIYNGSNTKSDGAELEIANVLQIYKVLGRQNRIEGRTESYREGSDSRKAQKKSYGTKQEKKNGKKRSDSESHVIVVAHQEQGCLVVGMARRKKKTNNHSGASVITFFFSGTLNLCHAPAILCHTISFCFLGDKLCCILMILLLYSVILICNQIVVGKKGKPMC